MDVQIDIELNQLLKFLEQHLADFENIRIRRFIKRLEEIFEIDIIPNDEDKTSLIDAAYYSVLNFIDDLNQKNKVNECRHYLKEVELQLRIEINYFSKKRRTEYKESINDERLRLKQQYSDLHSGIISAVEDVI